MEAQVIVNGAVVNHPLQGTYPQSPNPSQQAAVYRKQQGDMTSERPQKGKVEADAMVILASSKPTMGWGVERDWDDN